MTLNNTKSRPETTVDARSSRAVAQSAPRGDGWLIASAIGLAAVVLLLASGVLNRPAMADVTSQAGGFTMLTTDDGTDEALIVVDNRTEQLLVYQVQADNEFELVDRESLPELFRQARLKAGVDD